MEPVQAAPGPSWAWIDCCSRATRSQNAWLPFLTHPNPSCENGAKSFVSIHPRALTHSSCSGNLGCQHSHLILPALLLLPLCPQQAEQ